MFFLDFFSTLIPLVWQIQNSPETWTVRMSMLNLLFSVRSSYVNWQGCVGGCMGLFYSLLMNPGKQKLSYGRVRPTTYVTESVDSPNISGTYIKWRYSSIKAVCKAWLRENPPPKIAGYKVQDPSILGTWNFWWTDVFMFAFLVFSVAGGEGGEVVVYTLPKTNIAPKNGGFK